MSPRISGVGLLSPLGPALPTLASCLQSGKARPSPRTAPLVEGLPDVLGAAVEPAFAVTSVLGRRGTRELDRLTGMIISAADSALRASEVRERTDADRLGMIVGTSVGSVESIVGFAKDIFMKPEPYFVDPIQFPNVTLNAAAGATAVWHGLKGANVSVCGGHLAGLQALRYAERALILRHADGLVVSVADELGEARAWGHHRASRRRERAVLLGEGAVAFVLELPADDEQQCTDEALDAPRATPITGHLLGTVAAYHPRRDPEQQVRLLVAAVEALLERVGVARSEVVLASSSRPAQTPRGALERTALERVFGEQRACIRASLCDTIGDTYNAAFGFEVAGALAHLDAARPTGTALVVGSSSSGQIGCALLGGRAASARDHASGGRS